MLDFCKMSGAGNDFILGDNRNGAWSRHDLGKLARATCDRHLGVGADGLIVVENSKKAQIRTRIFNSDGGEADFCGNGFRCAARFALMKVIAGKRMTIETRAGVIEAENLHDGEVLLKFNMPAQEPALKELMVGRNSVKGYYVVAGVPHYILFVKSADAAPVSALAPSLRSHPSLPPGGANIDFLEMPPEQPYPYRTFERGVEGETLACGSGALSIGWLLKKTFGKRPPFRLLARSGRILEVDFPSEKPGSAEASLKGEAAFIFKGTLSEEFLMEASR